MAITVDLTNYKDRVGNRIAPGTYRVIVEDVEQDTARSGNTMINMWFRVQGGDFDGATVVDRLVLTEKSLFRVVGFMQAIGMPTPKKRLSVDINKFVNQVLEIQVEDGDPYNGRVKSEVRGYARVKKSEKAAEADLSDLEEPEEPTPAESAPSDSEGSSGVSEASESASTDTDTAEDSEEVDLDSINNL